jgi:catechol 2,3-dioxygenase-like lactoylglutathione lyase family enzyme
MTSVNGSWAKGLDAITPFVENIAEAKRFYEDVFGLPVAYEDDVSAMFRFGATLVNLLQVTEAPVLIEPAPVAK